MIGVYFRYKAYQLRRWMSKNYEYPYVAVVTMILLGAYAMAMGYEIASGVCIVSAFFYWLVCDYKTGDWKAWYRENYKERFNVRQHADNEQQGNKQVQ